jgi:hypothetical protein
MSPPFGLTANSATGVKDMIGVPSTSRWMKTQPDLRACHSGSPFRPPRGERSRAVRRLAPEGAAGNPLAVPGRLVNCGLAAGSATRNLLTKSRVRPGMADLRGQRWPGSPGPRERWGAVGMIRHAISYRQSNLTIFSVTFTFICDNVRPPRGSGSERPFSSLSP